MPKKKNHKLRLKLESIIPDTIQYRPWRPYILPDNLYVEVEIPIEEVITIDEDGTTITLKGMGDMLVEVSMEMEHAYESFEDRLTKEIDKYKE